MARPLAGLQVCVSVGGKDLGDQLNMLFSQALQRWCWNALDERRGEPMVGIGKVAICKIRSSRYHPGTFLCTPSHAYEGKLGCCKLVKSLCHVVLTIRSQAQCRMALISSGIKNYASLPT
jgi:hypothetical protein